MFFFFLLFYSCKLAGSIESDVCAWYFELNVAWCSCVCARLICRGSSCSYVLWIQIRCDPTNNGLRKSPPVLDQNREALFVAIPSYIYSFWLHSCMCGFFIFYMFLLLWFSLALALVLASFFVRNNDIIQLIKCFMLNSWIRFSRLRWRPRLKYIHLLYNVNVHGADLFFSFFKYSVNVHAIHSFANCQLRHCLLSI